MEHNGAQWSTMEHNVVDNVFDNVVGAQWSIMEHTVADVNTPSLCVLQMYRCIRLQMFR